MTFGVVYIHSGGIWSDICELSRSTLPAGVPVTVIDVADHAESLQCRLSLADNLPYDRTLYLDCDVVYCQPEFPEWLTRFELPRGIAMSAWWVANQSWGWQADWSQYLQPGTISNLPHWFRSPNAGLMLLEKHAAPILEAWRETWQRIGTPLIEPAYVEAFKDRPQQFDNLPGDFHQPSTRATAEWMQPERHQFIHAIISTEDKLNEMQRCLEFAGQNNPAVLSGAWADVAG